MSDGLIPAISIRQPWAWCTLHAGKLIENRSRAYKYRGPVLIHASKGCTPKEWNDFYNGVANLTAPYASRVLTVIGGMSKIPERNKMQRGGIVGRAVIVGCVHESEKHLLAASDKPSHAQAGRS